MGSAMSVGNTSVGMEPQAEGSEVTCFSRSGELKLNGTSAGLSQISFKKSQFLEACQSTWGFVLKNDRQLCTLH